MFYNERVLCSKMETDLRRRHVPLSDFTQYLTPKVKPVPKPKTFAEMVDHTIEEQIKIANGGFVKGSKKNADGEYPPKKGWYNDDKGIASIKIGILPVFPDNNMTIPKERYLALINDMKNWRDDQGWLDLLNAVENKKKENDRKRKEKSA